MRGVVADQGDARVAVRRTCLTCVMDVSDPDISFDDSGVCSHCRAYRDLVTAVAARSAPGALEGLLDRIKRSGEGKRYDCVIGLSGGIDSSYLALVAKRLGLRPLAVHLDNGWDEELAVANIEKIVTGLSIDLVTIVLDWQEFRDLQLAFLKASTPDAEIPTDHAIHAALYRVAARHGVRHVLAGTNVATEGGGVPAWSQGHADWRYISTIHRLFGTRPLRTYPHYGVLELLWHRVVKGTRWVSLLDYVEYDKDEAIRSLRHEIGWTPYRGKHGESRYTKFYQNWILPQKFGFDKRLLHLSSLIWSGQLTRAEALQQISLPVYADSRELDEDREYVRKKLEISAAEFEAIMEAPPKTFWEFASYKRALRGRPWLMSLYRRLKRD